jgi:hypothetical protein
VLLSVDEQFHFLVNPLLYLRSTAACFDASACDENGKSVLAKEWNVQFVDIDGTLPSPQVCLLTPICSSVNS